MCTFFIVSVGTSLIGHNNRHNNTENLPDTESDWNDNPNDYNATLKQFVGDMKTQNTLNQASAELSSLLKDNSLRPQPGDRILLLHTDTSRAEACARHIKYALEQLSFNNIRCRQVEKLAEASAKNFYDQGLPNLITCLYDEMSKAPRVVLVPTGGYKAIIPYFVLMGILLNAPCRYVYEESDIVVELPPLPLHADLCEWTGIEAVLETLCGKSEDNAKKWQIYNDYEKKLTNLLVKDDDGTFKLSPLCERLQERVERDRRRSELQFRTQNSPLLRYLENFGEPHDDTLKRMFLRLAEIGPYIWKGDRVPEMADHALLHHADLFHLAERILLPVFYWYEENNNGPFLSPEELFVLLGALHLHDCGHVVGSVDLKIGKNHRLLPTEVRDHHHVLGYLRLTQPDKHGGTGKWIHDGLTNVPPTSRTTRWEEGDLVGALEAIATIGLYHRKAMKLRQTEPEEGKYPYPYPFLQGAELEKIPCLDEFSKDRPLKVRGKTLKTDRIRLLVCLLRIIDSLDEQASRTGGKEAVKFHLEQLDTEAKDETERADGLKIALEAVENALKCLDKSEVSRCNQLDKLVEFLFTSYKNKESKQSSTKAPVPEKVPSFWEGFDKLFPHESPMRHLALEYTISRIRAKFKAFQKEPYEEKLNVESILITHRFENKNIIFRIDLKRDQEYIKNLGGKKDPKKLLENIAGEYEITEKVDDSSYPQVVKKTLNDAGILFEYQTQ